MFILMTTVILACAHAQTPRCCPTDGFHCEFISRLACCVFESVRLWTMHESVSFWVVVGVWHSTERALWARLHWAEQKPSLVRGEIEAPRVIIIRKLVINSSYKVNYSLKVFKVKKKVNIKWLRDLDRLAIINTYLIYYDMLGHLKPWDLKEKATICKHCILMWQMIN